MKVQKAAASKNAQPKKKKGSQTPQLLPAILSVLIILLAAQASSVLDVTSKWWAVTATAIAAFLIAVLLCWRNFCSAQPRAKSNTQMQPDFGVEPAAGSVTIHLFANYRWPGVFAVALLLVVSILSGLKSSGAFMLQPAGTFANPQAPSGKTLSKASGKFLFELKNVQNVSGDLIWLELRVPEYTSSYGQDYLYYYTPADPDPDSTNQYSAVLQIDNTGLARTAEVVTAYACMTTDSLISVGNSDPQTSKVAGCSTLKSICVLLPSCKGRNCIPETFTTPTICKKEPTYLAKKVS